LKKLIDLLIGFYQKFVSPVLGPHCRYRPTCSEYCRQAIKKRGLLKGSLLSVWRILRCNPLSRGGWDPVE
jgi:hypothetical protein